KPFQNVGQASSLPVLGRLEACPTRVLKPLLSTGSANPRGCLGVVPLPFALAPGNGGIPGDITISFSNASSSSLSGLLRDGRKSELCSPFPLGRRPGRYKSTHRGARRGR